VPHAGGPAELACEPFQRTAGVECRDNDKAVGLVGFQGGKPAVCRQIIGIACLARFYSRYFGPLLPKVLVGTAGLGQEWPGTF